MDNASRIPPSANWAINVNPFSSISIPSFLQTTDNLYLMSCILTLLKSNLWQREIIVGKTLLGSVVAKIKITWAGGSSIVFNNALNAPDVIIWTSSII